MMGEAGDTKNNVIKHIFQTMEYGADSESTAEVTEWLKTKENRVFAYIDKKDEQPNGEVLSIINPNSDEKLCDIYVPEVATIETILKKVAATKNKWSEIAPTKRSEIIYKWGAEIQKRQNLFIQLEIAVRGILSKDTKTKALPLLTDYLQYYSSFCAKNNAEGSSASSKGLAIGIIPDNNSLSVFGCILGPCLASGHNVILQTGPQLSLAATFLIELATQVGVPEGTVRLIPGNIDPNVFFIHPEVTTIFIFDDLYKEQYLIANHFNKKLLHFSSTGTSMIVFNNCDLDSACHSVADAAWGSKGMLPWSVRNIFVQEDVFEKFIHKLKHELSQLKVGKSYKKNLDLSFPDGTVQDKIKIMVEKAKNEGVDVYQPDPNNIIPTVFIGGNIFPNNVIKEDLNVPIVTVVAFRSINEAVALANNTRQGLGISVWSESTSLVNEITEKLQVGNIWLNSHGLFAAEIPISPYKTSGNSFFGGSAGFYDYFYVKPLKNETSSKLQSGDDAMVKVITVAKKSQDGWFKLSHFGRIKHLQLAAQNLQSDKTLEKWIDDWVALIYDYVTKPPVENFHKYKNFNVVSTREPCGVVAVETPYDKDFHNKRLIIAALLQGNAVIVLNECEETSAFYSTLSKLLPQGVLTVIPHSLDAMKVAALHKELNVYVGEANNKVFGSLPLKSSSKFKVANLDNWDEVRNKVTLAKNVWLNKGQSFM